MTALSIALVCCVVVIAAVARDVVLRWLDARVETHRAQDVAAIAADVQATRELIGELEARLRDTDKIARDVSMKVGLRR